MNQTQLIGRWCQEHDMKYSQAGKAILKNTLAVTRPFDKENSDFIRVVMFEKTAELAGNYTAKGSQVAIIGRIQTGSYKKDDGSTVYTTDVIADRIEFLDSKGSQPQQQNGSQQRQQNNSGYSKANDDPFAGE
jgi:single-strand DNA-binding protein